MQKTHHKTHHTSTHHKTKTHVVTNTQLALAVAAAVFAGGLAYVVTPRGNYGPNACTVGSVQFMDRCNGSNYRGVEYRCSDGSTGEITSRRLCRNTRKLQRMVADRCAQQQCVQDVPEQEVPAPAPQRAVVNPNSCEVSSLQFLDRCGHNQYSKIQITCSNGDIKTSQVSCQSVRDLQEVGSDFCAAQDCSPRQNINVPDQDQNTDTNQGTNGTEVTEVTEVTDSTGSQGESSPVEVAPIPVITQAVPRLLIPGPVSFARANGKISLQITLENKGTVNAQSDAKYTFSFLNAQGNVVMTYLQTLGFELKVGDAENFGIVVPVPIGATAVRATVDPSVAGFENNTVTTQIPVDFLPRET